ncbi:multidrug-resistance type transporter aminotriazole resistance [Cyanidiococcus yangmingshanensis]|uniref:Multidrug-resistance type transporter aminotriazole resistance n=1 Tax=Cyanidiococcus yangmingshanensis TaxID=2690220 RepID=A0A7J7IJX3_9RHOD|nr:multidrug-resistance type transporter aminotriazole resistance [Cyanidiococcus yangmingshanensis]
MPQLLSRVTAHTSTVVRSELCSLLADCVVAYPGQAIWCILPLASALDATRATTGQEIIEEARRRGDAALGALLDSGLELCAQLVRVCMQTPPRGLRQMTASMHLRGLRRLLRERLQSFAIPVPVSRVSSSAPAD